MEVGSGLSSKSGTEEPCVFCCWVKQSGTRTHSRIFSPCQMELLKLMCSELKCAFFLKPPFDGFPACFKCYDSFSKLCKLYTQFLTVKHKMLDIFKSYQQQVIDSIEIYELKRTSSGGALGRVGSPDILILSNPTKFPYFYENCTNFRECLTRKASLNKPLNDNKDKEIVEAKRAFEATKRLLARQSAIADLEEARVAGISNRQSVQKIAPKPLTTTTTTLILGGNNGFVQPLSASFTMPFSGASGSGTGAFLASTSTATSSASSNINLQSQQMIASSILPQQLQQQTQTIQQFPLIQATPHQAQPPQTKDNPNSKYKKQGKASSKKSSSKNWSWSWDNPQNRKIKIKNSSKKQKLYSTTDSSDGDESSLSQHFIVPDIPPDPLDIKFEVEEEEEMEFFQRGGDEREESIGIYAQDPLALPPNNEDPLDQDIIDIDYSIKTESNDN